MGEAGIPVIIENEDLNIFDWFPFGYPSVVILDHTMTVFDLTSVIDNNYINAELQEALANCLPCGDETLLGDLNGDGGVNILDVVLLANCILSGDCHQFGSIGDLNGDGAYDILDIVSLVNFILNE